MASSVNTRAAVFLLLIFVLHGTHGSQETTVSNDKHNQNTTTTAPTTTTTTTTTSTTTTSTAAATTAPRTKTQLKAIHPTTPKLSWLDRFLGRKIAKAIEKVEEDVKEGRIPYDPDRGPVSEKGFNSPGTEEGSSLTTGSVVPEGWSTPPPYPPATSEVYVSAPQPVGAFRLPQYQTDSNDEEERPEKLANRPRYYFMRDSADDGEGDEDRGREADKFGMESRMVSDGTRWENRNPWERTSEPSRSFEWDWQRARKTSKGYKRQHRKGKKQRPHGKCKGCSKRGKALYQAREMHKEMLRQQLLDKLRLVPHLKEEVYPPKLPAQLIPGGTFNDHAPKEDNYYAKPTRLLVFGRDLGRNHRLRKPATGSYQFGVTGKVKGDVTKAELWVYKMRDPNDVHGQTLVVTELKFNKKGRLRERSLVARLDTDVTEGWVRFDVTRLVTRWEDAQTPPALQMLAIRCKTCHRANFRAIFGVKSNFRPVLAVHERWDGSVGRGRRSTETCDPDVECCKMDLTIRFSDLGIHEILNPKTIKADYCYGHCNSPTQGHWNHTKIVQRLRYSSQSGVDTAMFNRLKPCCVPVVLRPTTIMYYLNEGHDMQVSNVPNFLVDKCGCA